MGSHYQCRCGCDLQREMEQSDDLFAFIKEHAPTEVVLENMHEASKAHLVCTCCLYANALSILAARSSSIKYLRKTFVRATFKKLTLNHFNK